MLAAGIERGRVEASLGRMGMILGVVLIVLGIVGAAAVDSASSGMTIFGSWGSYIVLGIIVGYLLSAGSAHLVTRWEEKRSDRDPNILRLLLGTIVGGIVLLPAFVPWGVYLITKINHPAKPFAEHTCEVKGVAFVKPKRSSGYPEARLECGNGSEKITGEVDLTGAPLVVPGSRVRLPLAKGSLGIWVQDTESVLTRLPADEAPPSSPPLGY